MAIPFSSSEVTRSRTRLCATLVLIATAFRPAAGQEQTTPNGSQDSSSYSLQLPADRQTAARFQKFRSHLAASESAAAINELETILSASTTRDDSLVSVDSMSNWPARSQVFLGLREAVFRSMSRSEKNPLRLYQTQFQAGAEQALTDAIAQDNPDGVRAVVRQFELTRSGLSALQFLAARALDRGQNRIALAASRRILQHPELTARERIALERRLRFLLDQRTETFRAADDGFTVPLDATSDTLIPAEVLPSQESADWLLKTEDDTASLVADALHEHGQQSIPVVPRARPQVFGSRVLFRTGEGITAFDSEKGREAWRHQFETSRSQRTAGLAMNISLQDLAARALAHDIQLNSVQSRITFDGQRVIFTETLNQNRNRTLPRGGPFQKGTPGNISVRNRLMSVTLATGQVAWVSKDRGFPLDEKPIYYLGPPTAIDGRLYGLAQSGSALRVYALNADDGRLLWSIRIGQTAREGATNADWRMIACPVLEATGVLICPTAGGALVGVDLVTRDIRWAVRYPRHDTAPALSRLGRATGQSRRPWWHGWRDVTIRSVTPTQASDVGASENTGREDNSLVIVTAPDRHEVLAIEPASGRLRWQRPVESPLFVADASPDRIVIAERHRFLALDPSSGQIDWESPALEPSGTGFLETIKSPDVSDATRFYVYPTRSRRIAAVRLSDGRVLKSPTRASRLTGNLARSGSFVFEQSSGQSAAYRSLDAKIESLEKTARSGSASEAVALARSLTAAGRFERAAAELREQLKSIEKREGNQIPAGPDTRALRRALIQTLTTWVEVDPQKHDVIQHEIRSLFQDDSIREEIEFRHAAARTTARLNESQRALERYLQLADLNPEGDLLAEDAGPARMVRYDRLLQGELLDLIDALNGKDRQSLKRAFDEHLAETIRSPDPFAIQRLAGRFSGLPWTGTIQLHEQAQVGQRYLDRQLNLLRLTDHPDRNVRSEALLRLGELYAEQSYERDRAAVLLQWHKLNAGAEPDGKSSDSGSVDQRDRLLETLRQSDWRGQNPVITSRAQVTGSAQCLNVPVHCERGSLFDRLNVSIAARANRSGRLVRFAGDVGSGAWQIRLPPSSSSLARAFTLPVAWSAGHMLVLQVGGMIYGIAPFAENGEPRARLIWSRDVAEQNHIDGHQFVPVIPGYRTADFRYLDAFDRPIAIVGPVRAGYVCCHNRGRIVCLDTASGKVLWQRYEVPRNARSQGDEHHIFLLSHSFLFHLHKAKFPNPDS